MTTTNDTKSPIAARDFTDEGTKRSFFKGKPIENVEPGMIENYRAAGLLVPDDAQQPAADGSVTA